MPLQTARHYAAKLVHWLLPHCHRVEITGSIRRERPQCSDIDLCLIPRETIYRDMFQVETGRQQHCWMHLVNYVNNFSSHTLKPGQQRPLILSGGEHAGKRMTLRLPACQLDLWFATPENFANKMINSTGSKEHNVWLAQRATDQGLHWFVSEGLVRLGDLREAGINPKVHGAADMARTLRLIAPAKDESSFYALLNLGFIRPPDRELPWLKKHIDSGL